MPRAQTNKLYRTFVKGLITEAGFLTYPEDASTDELNTVLHKKGNRTRRLGMDYEDGSIPRIMPGFDADAVTTEYLWKAVDNEATINFVCLQVGNIIHFFNADAVPFSSGKKTFTIDLSLYKSPAATTDNIKSQNVEMIAGKGFLFIAQEYIDPLSVEYDPATDTINVVKIVIVIRDFDGVNDGLANDQEPNILTPEHFYNLRNQGWVTPGTEVTIPTEPPPEGGGTPENPAPSDPGTDGTVPYVAPSHEYYDPYTGYERPYRPHDREGINID